MIQLVNPMRAVGGGPWLVLAECPARRHNTGHAARGYKGAPKCICPRGVWLRKQEHRGYESRRRALRGEGGERLTRRSPSPLPGRGPWRVLAECPALLHNSVRSVTKGRPEHRCICPRGLALLELEKQRSTQRRIAYRDLSAESIDRQREGKRLKRMGITPESKGGPRWEPEKAVMRAQYFANTMGALIPSMPAAACKTTFGIKLSDRAYSGEAGGEGEMKLLCGRCPERLACATWVLADERLPGEWGGVYGGMSVGDRRKIAAAKSVHRGIRAENKQSESETAV